MIRRTAQVICCLVMASVPALSQVPGMPMPIDLQNSAEAGWLKKKVLASRVLDDTSNPATWLFQGQGKLSSSTASAPSGARSLRVDVEMNHGEPAPTRTGLATINLKRKFASDDWTSFNRISFWIRPEVSGFPMLPIEINLHNDGAEKVPDVYHREGIHFVTLTDRKWQHVVWEITPLARDKVTSLEIGYWVNKKLPNPGDSVAFEISKLELERVETPDHYEGWDVAPGRISFSNTGYATGSSKTALASGLHAPDFQVIRMGANGTSQVVATKAVRVRKTRLGEFQEMDFTEVRQPGSYVIQAGDTRTRPFRIDDDVWSGTISKVINFFYGERCGFAVPGSHDVCHRDWLATHGDQKIVMNGGWHDAGDLSQGLVNTGEATYAMFALAERLKARGGDPALLRRVIEEAKWGLDWVLKVRFDGGYRIGFASMSIWTNGIVGDADDRAREALNNPNVNYIAAASEGIAYRVLKDTDPSLAARSLKTAEDDWRYAIAGTEGPATWSTPAFAASPMELAGIGILASLELYQDTGKEQYAAKAVELARVVVASQQRTYVGHDFPLAGFFYTGPDKQTLFHQFHRGNDQAPLVAMARLCELLPNHKDWMDWYSVVALYSEYQKASARTTEPYGVLPAYVYTDREYLDVPEKGALHQATRDSFREQVLRGMPMGDGYYLKAFPVWFARRGNYGVLLSQAKGLSASAHLRGDLAAADLAQRQLEWVVGRNPFVQSTLYGEGYDWTQQYSVSSGDIVGALPVGMETRGTSDAPYWPSQNCYVYKEVWVHSAARWLWLMQDLAGPAVVEGRVAPDVKSVELVESATGRVLPVEVDRANGTFRAVVPEGAYTIRAGNERLKLTALAGETYRPDLRSGRALDFAVTAPKHRETVTISVTASGRGRHRFVIRADNLTVDEPARTVVLTPGKDGKFTWTASLRTSNAPWVAVVIPDGDVSLRREVVELR